jgi:hypothetical protein
MKPQISKYLFFISIVCVISIYSCATIPKAAPDLSIELGKQIRELESNHKYFVNKFFDEKRKRVDEFIEEEWLPLFAKNFFKDPVIKGTFEQVINLPEDERPKELFNYLIYTGPKLQQKLNDKRREMIAPLDDLQKQIEDQLTLKYDNAQTVNNSITNFLSSASKVEENRDRYLSVLGINQSSINKYIDQTDSVLNSLVQKANIVEGVSNTLTDSELDGKISTYIKKIKELKDKISGQ